MQTNLYDWIGIGIVLDDGNARLTAFSRVFAVSRTSFESINFEYGGGNLEILAIFEHIIWPLHLTVPVNMSFI